MAKELVDLVDENDRVVESLDRTSALKQSEYYLRFVDGFLRNPQGKLWIPKRLPNKSIAPNGLDFSFAGFVKSGETYAQAAQRELLEELGVKADMHLRLLAVLSPREYRISGFSAVFELKTAVNPHYNPTDFSGGSWWYSTDIIDLLDTSNDFAKSDLLPVLRAVYG